MTRFVPSLRLRTVVLTALFSFSTFFVQATPSEVLPRPDELSPQPAQALACATNAKLDGYLTSSSSSTTLLTRSTTGNVFGYVSNVVGAWSCTAWYRYSGLAWQRPSGFGNFDWGNLIHSLSVSCNWVVGSTDYLKANDTTDCADSDAEYAMPIFLEETKANHERLDAIYTNDPTPDATGDFMFIHSDCESYYDEGGGEVIQYNHEFTTTDTANRPGSNCDPLDIDGTNNAQTLVVDGVPPSTGFDWPSVAGPTVIATAGVGVQFDATDAVAGFDATNKWSLQRRSATWSGSACQTFANDGTAVTGTTNLVDQVVSQGLLADGSCYQWTLAATDANGNIASVKTSGIIRVDTSGVLGRQPQHTLESWDLGAGTSLSVNVGSGNLVLEHPIVSLPIRGSSVDLALTYNRHDTTSVGMGTGWRLNMLRRLTINADNTVTFTDGSGARHTFTAPTGSPVTTYTRPPTLYGNLVKDTGIPANEFVLTYRDGSKDKFDISGSSALLVREEDRFGNGVTLAYTSGNLTSITDWANVSGGIVQTSGSGNRLHRFFYSGGTLSGWAGPLNTSGSCPTGGSHVTCLTYTGTGSAAGLTAVARTQTYETFTSGTLGSATRVVTTSIAYAGADVTTVTDAEGGATTISHPATWATKVVRPGTPASETTYTRLGTVDDAYARIGSTKRKLLGAMIESTTAFDATYKIEPVTITEDKGGSLERATTYTYVANSLGLVSRVDAPLDGTYRHYTDFTYNQNNDVTQMIVSRQGDGTLRTTTRYCYDATTCNTTDADPKLFRVISNYQGTGVKGGANGHVENVTTEYQVDPYGRRSRETRSVYAAGGTLLDSRVTAFCYSADCTTNDGTFLQREIVNHVNGLVDSPGDDIDPNAGTNARTDLTTAFTYDTAGNLVSTADPRRAIEAAKLTTLGADDFIARSVFDALDRVVIDQLPTTPGAGECTPASLTCRQASTTYDELGLVRESRDIPDVITATQYDRLGRALETYEDPPPVGSASRTSISTYDAAGRVLTIKDRRQVADANLGWTAFTYDELGRQTDMIEARKTPTPLAEETTTRTTYDSLDRPATEKTAYLTPTEQTTTYTYDPADRVIKTDDEFTCATTTYNWQGVALTVVEGLLSGSCTGGTTRTTTNTYDALARLTQSSITGGDVVAAVTYDSLGRERSTSSTIGGVTTSSALTFNLLDQLTAEIRSDSGTATSWTKANFDAAGNPTDRCVWNAAPSEACKAVGTAMSPEPAVRTTTAYDARNNRISLKVPGTGETTYDPAHNYALDKVYVPTRLDGSGAVIAEQLTDYGYDARHRLTSVTHQVCPVTAGTHTCSSGPTSIGSSSYTYDDNDSRTQVVESVSGGAATTTNYCYDPLNRLTAAKATTACTSSPTETYTYDAAGNRTKTVISGTTTWFGYDGQGQLCKTGATSGIDCSPVNVTYDDIGRTLTWNGWTLTYEGEGRLATACKVAGCATGDKVTMRYDGEGRRVELVTRPNNQSATTTTFRYVGGALAQELTDATVSREYVTDEQGAIVKVCDPTCGAPTTSYLVTYNGHGDALALWRINSDGSLTLANSYTYTTWGHPTTTVASGFSDLKFRFLYVGRQGVQWDNDFGLGLLYMQARQYSPAIGRFVQPDPAAIDANLYAYVDGNPTSDIDPSGLGKKISGRGGGGGGGMRGLKVVARIPPPAQPAVVTPASPGFGHAFKHAPQWFGRAVKPTGPEGLQWARLINHAAASSKVLLTVQTGTRSVSYVIRAEGKYLLVQFMRMGPNPGRVLTAYVPNPDQLRAILMVLNKRLVHNGRIL